MMRVGYGIAVLVALLAGCNQNGPPPGQAAPPAKVEVGGPQGGVHVNDPANGTQVDVGGGDGVQVKTPDSKVDVR